MSVFFLEKYSVRIKNNSVVVNLWRLCFYLTAMLLIAPMPRKHYMAYLLPGLFLGFLFLLNGKFKEKPVQKYLIWSSIVSVMIIPFIASVEPGHLYLFILVSLLIMIFKEINSVNTPNYTRVYRA